MDSQKKYTPQFSFEFFPPKTPEGEKKLLITRNELAKLQPKYFSVTFGAGGSTQQGTIDTVLDIQKAGLAAAPHLSCIGSTKDSIETILDTYKESGINRIVALRGDMPSGMQEAGSFRYANELVEFIRNQYGSFFHIEVAAYPEVHPQAQDAQNDLANFKRKVGSGANAAITQYFYNNDAYFRFIDNCEKIGIDIPIIPGIMPITNYTQLARFSDMCGAEIPRWIKKHLQSFGDDREGIRAFGEDVITHMCERLLQAGAPGLHFYTMNQVGPSKAIWNNLGIKKTG